MFSICRHVGEAMHCSQEDYYQEDKHSFIFVVPARVACDKMKAGYLSSNTGCQKFIVMDYKHNKLHAKHMT